MTRKFWQFSIVWCLQLCVNTKPKRKDISDDLREETVAESCSTARMHVFVCVSVFVSEAGLWARLESFQDDSGHWANSGPRALCLTSLYYTVFKNIHRCQSSQEWTSQLIHFKVRPLHLRLYRPQ